MLFQSRYIVRHFGLHRTPETLEVEKTDPPPLKLSLRLITEEELEQFYEKDDWVALVSAEESISDRVAAEFNKDQGVPAQAEIDVSTRANSRMHSFLEEFLRLVRWRNGVYGDYQLIRCIKDGPRWSADGKTWKQVRGLGSVTTCLELRSVPYEVRLFDQIKGMLLAKDYEPVGHEMLREAWNLKDHSPRSALMLGVAALEVGVKAFVARMVPQSEWLCFEMPTPPVVKMLEEYLPNLPVNLRISDKVFIPKKIIDTLKVAVVKRNRVAHKGMTVVNDKSLADILTHVQMTLYFLDYYAGHSWAIKNIRDSDMSDLVMKEL